LNSSSDEEEYIESAPVCQWANLWAGKAQAKRGPPEPRKHKQLLASTLALLDEPFDLLATFAPNLLIELGTVSLSGHLAPFATRLTDGHRPSILLL
jgi:hypothetical protein